MHFLTESAFKNAANKVTIVNRFVNGIYLPSFTLSSNVLTNFLLDIKKALLKVENIEDTADNTIPDGNLNLILPFTISSLCSLQNSTSVLLVLYYHMSIWQINGQWCNNCPWCNNCMIHPISIDFLHKNYLIMERRAI